MVYTRIKKANKILGIITLCLVGAIVLFSMVIGVLCLGFNYKVLWVLGDSSIHGIKPFSVVLVQPCNIEDLRVGDRQRGVLGDFAVRLFGSGYVTHEVCEKYQDEDTGVWYFDTMQAGDPYSTQTDGETFERDFVQKDLVGKVVAKESIIGKLLAWIQGYPNIETSLGARPDKILGLIRIVSLAVILYGLGKFADFMHYKDTVF